MQTLTKYLGKEKYPGRGMLVGRLEDKRLFIIYFLMGRSNESRNRVIRSTDGVVKVEKFDLSIQSADYILYQPVKIVGNALVASSGDQMDAIVKALDDWDTFDSALMMKVAEKSEEGHKRPRLSLIVNLDTEEVEISLVKEDGDVNERFFFIYDKIKANSAYFISTYSDGTKGKAFSGEPMKVSLSGSISKIAGDIWSTLDEEYKVSLYAAVIENGAIREEIIRNKLQEK